MSPRRPPGRGRSPGSRSGKGGKAPKRYQPVLFVAGGLAVAVVLWKLSSGSSSAGGTAYGAPGSAGLSYNPAGQTTASSASGAGATTAPAVSTRPLIPGTKPRAPTSKAIRITAPMIWAHVPHPPLPPNRLL